MQTADTKDGIWRQAQRGDIPAMHRVRLSVRENRLTSSIVTEADYPSAIEETGRGWVVEAQGAVVGFAIGNVTDGNIWALFVVPGPWSVGVTDGSSVDGMVSWLWSQGLRRLRLTTDPRRQGGITKAGNFEEGVLLAQLGVALAQNVTT